jgi:hypothetical protein
MIAEKAKSTFYDAFWKEYLSRGFGNMPKRDMDVLIFHLFEKTDVFNGKSNFEIARTLRTTPAKIKSLKYESVLRFDDSDIVSDNFLKQRFASYLKNNPPLEFDEKYLKLQIEDPVLLDHLKAICKENGVITDGSFNGEILKVDESSFIKLLEQVQFKDSKKSLKQFKSQYNTPYRDFLKNLWKTAKEEGTKKGLNVLASRMSDLLLDNSDQILSFVKLTSL